MPRRPHRQPLVLFAMAFFVACSGGASCGGCSCLQKIPGGYVGRKLDNAVVARVTGDGFAFVSQNFTALLAQSGLSNPIAVPVPCTSVSFGSNGHLCDQNRNDSCDPGEQCNLSVNLLNLTIAPGDAAGNTGLLRASARLQINTGDMWMRTCAATLFGACICRLSCAANFDSARSGMPYDTFSADVDFTIDVLWGRILSFNVGNIGGIAALESGDLSVNTSGWCSAIACGVLDIGFIKSYILDQFVKPQLMSQVQRAMDDARCRKCDAAAPCPAGSACSGGKCMAGAACVPLTMGMEGRMDLSQSGPMAGALDSYTVAGGTVASRANSFFSVGVMGGAEPYTGDQPDGGPSRAPSPCVPEVPEPTGMVPPPDFSAVDAGYHVGVAIGTNYLNQLSWAAHQSGAMCLDVGTAQFGMLETGLLKTFLPSLGRLATVDGHDAPMIVAVRPKAPPEITIGAGTFDAGVALEPLIRVEFKDLNIDLYAMIAERYVRLFRITADVALPLSLLFEGCDKVTPAIGDVKQLITNIRTSGSELLAEDPTVLADLIPSLLTLAQGSLANGLGPTTLPTIGSFKLKVDAAQGVTPIAGTRNFEHLALFAQLMLSTSACAVVAPETVASLKRSEIPDAAALRATGHGLPLPVAVLDVLARNAQGEAEFDYRVDEGLWSTFVKAPSGELAIAHPAFLFQGVHRIEVRSRLVAEPHAVSMPVPVSFVVDYEPPEVHLTPDRQANRVFVTASDVVTPAAKLEYAYAVGDGPASAFGAPRDIDLAAVEAQGGVTVQVRDEAGHVGTASWRAATTGLRPATDAAPGSPASSVFGCGVTGGSGLLGLLGLALLARRRR